MGTKLPNAGMMGLIILIKRITESGVDACGERRVVWLHVPAIMHDIVCYKLQNTTSTVARSGRSLRLC
jgi:hypothetical protein